MKLTKEEIAAAIKDLSIPYGNVRLICDEYQITLSVERAKGMTYRVMTYIDGVFKGEWMLGDSVFPQQKYLRKSEHAVCSKARKAKMEKNMGKRRVQEDSFYSRKIVMYMGDWASGRAALSHLCRVCGSMKINIKINDGDQS